MTLNQADNTKLSLKIKVKVKTLHNE